ncbi:hypothetical protein CTZ27_35415 [Streptomyces griseocarneus]|nr:hypothetical protein CTZ27_35415 [Streptomyces griseocarneus]
MAQERTAGRHPTLVEELRFHACTCLDPAVTVGAAGDDEVDYPAFWERVVGCAGWLTDHGVRPGDYVALEMDTTTSVMVASVAVPACGAVLVPLGASRGLRNGAQDTLRTLAALRVTRARWYLAGDDPAERQVAIRAAGLRVDVLGLAGCPTGAAGHDEEAVGTRPDPDRPALVQFSSGSLAAPRGIVLTHGNLAANLHALTRRVRFTAGRTVCWLPFTHDMGLIGSLWGSLYGGSAFRGLTPGSFIRHPLRWIEELSAFRATHTSAPPFAYAMAARSARRTSASDRLTGVDLSALRVAIIGAERVVPGLCARFEETFAAQGLPRHVLLPAYGLAENCVAVACRTPLIPSAVGLFAADALEHGRLVRTAPGPAARELIGHGTPLPGTEVRIISPDGQELPAGQVGEIRIRGMSVARRVILPDGTMHPTAQEDGLVPTGDLGALYDGELYVIGRSKEVVKYAGRLLAPADIEQAVLDAAPEELGAAAAVAVPREEETEDLVLFLELAGGRQAADEDRLTRIARLTVLREFRIPVSEVFIARRGALPRTTSGKVKRLSLGAACLTGTLPPSVRLSAAAP